MYYSTLIQFFVLTLISVGSTMPMKKQARFATSFTERRETPLNIAEHMIDLDEDSFVFNAFPTSRMSTDGTFNATTATAAGITRSKLGYVKIARSQSGLLLPDGQKIEYTLKLRGKVTFKGFKSKWMETAVSQLAKKSSNEFFNRFETERESLIEIAKENYFWFFQAAKNYGYSNDAETSDLVNSEEFTSLSKKTNEVLKSNERLTLEASYNNVIKGTSDGTGGLFKAFANILINQIELDSGEIINIVDEDPEVVVTDKEGNVIDKPEKPATVESEEETDDFGLDLSKGT